MNNDATVMHEELFSRGGLSLERLRALCLVAEHGSIAKAANGDPVRQSQFSRQLRDLGQFFGVDVTQRKGKGAELTPAGRKLATLGREILDALNDYRTAHAAGAKLLRVGAGESLIQWHLLPRIGQIRDELPDVVVSLKNLRGEQISTQLIEAQLDFGLVAGEDLPHGIETTKLGRLNYRLFVHNPGLVPLQSLRWKEVVKLPMIGLEGDGQLMRKLRKVADQLGVELKPALQCSSLPSVAVALKGVKGFAILPEIAAGEGLMSVDAPFLAEFSRTVSLAWSRRRVAMHDHFDRWRRGLQRALRW